MPDHLSAERPARGDDTRAQLIDAALALFGEKGVEATATRELARRAGVNLAAIAYHFGGKQGLNEAVARAVVADVGPRLGPLAARLAAEVTAARGDRARLAAAAATFLTRMLSFALESPQARRYMRFVLREYGMPSGAFPILFEGLISPLHRAVSALVGAALDRPAEAPETILRAHALIGQCLVFLLARAPLLYRLGWDDYTPERVRQIIAAAVPMALAALHLPMPPALEVADHDHIPGA